MPDPIKTLPVLPFDEVPVLNTTIPLTPAVPAFEVEITRDPLDLVDE